MDEEVYWWVNFLVVNFYGIFCIEVVGELVLICVLYGIIVVIG